MARILVERYAPQAHPDQLFNLRSKEISCLLDVVRKSDAVVLTIRASAPNLVVLPISPPSNATARFGLVTIAARTEAPLLDKVRALMREILMDSTSTPQKPKRKR